VIVQPSSIALDLQRLYKAGGLPRGESTGFRDLDVLYTVATGQWTVVTGWPGSGKSELLDAILVNLAKTGKWKFVIYSPENWPLELHVAHIIEKYLGIPFNPGPTQRLNEDDLESALAWMDGKFMFAKPDRPDIASILDEAAKLVSDGGGWKLGVVVDPWNQLEHHRPRHLSETEYISQTLTWVIDWVRQANCHLWMVAHPTKLQRMKDGALPIPTLHDISGGAHWWNKSDNGFCVHRNQAEGSPEVEVHVQKVRFRHIGHAGLTSLLYNRVTGQFRDAPKTSDFSYAER
jgi:twinkle protein